MLLRGILTSARVILAVSVTTGLVILTSCDSSGTSSPNGSSGPSASNGPSASSGPGASSGPSAPGGPGGTPSGPSAPGGPGEPSPPSWIKSLGNGVMIFNPAPASPGNDSPAAAVQGVFTALAARQFAKVCDYYAPDLRSPCRASFTGAPASQMPSATNAALGYVAVDGAQALVGTTGTFCSPGRTPRCYTNTDPAAIFSSGHTFAELWKATTALSSGPNAYALAACVEVGGKWYIWG